MKFDTDLDAESRTLTLVADASSDRRKENSMNRNELQRQIRLEGKTVDQLCSALGISRSAWFRKIGGRSELTQSEICTLRRELELDDELTGFIFFNDKVS